MCRYDHQERLTAREAQAHPYFDEVRRRDPQITAANNNTVVSTTNSYPANAGSSNANNNSRH